MMKTKKYYEVTLRVFQEGALPANGKSTTITEKELSEREYF